MIEWINFFILISAALLLLYLYIKSVEPATLEKKISENAYTKSSRYRLIAAVFEMVAFINYIVYFFFLYQFHFLELFPGTDGFQPLLQ